MRHKFRGKRIDGEWVYGSLWGGANHSFVTPANFGIGFSKSTHFIEAYAYEVLPESVGQWTGLVDLHGNEIYEGDVLEDSQGWKFEVWWDSDNSRFLGHHSKPRGDTYVCYVGRIDRHNKPSTKVIGNIHDNPELMEVE